MTISSTRTSELSIAQLVTVAYRRAGLLEVHQSLEPAMMRIGQEELQLVCDAMETRGLTSRSTEMLELAITTPTSSYELPSYVLSVVNNAMFIPATSTNPAAVEYIVRQMSREEWQTLTDKAVTSLTSSYFHRRDVVPNTIELWPRPDVDGTLRVQVQRLRADTNDGSKTVDFERYWSQALIYQLAGQLAMNASMTDKAITFFGLAEKEIERCMGNAREQASFQITFAHTSGWSRR